MLQHRWTLTTSCPVKKIRCERPHIVWFNLYEISRQENFTVETESKLIAQSSLKVGVGDEDWLLINSRVFMEADKNVSELHSDKGCTSMWLSPPQNHILTLYLDTVQDMWNILV